MESIAIADVLLAGRKMTPLSYLVPKGMSVEKGSRVEVFLREKKIMGTVVAVRKGPLPKYPLKEILSVTGSLSAPLQAFAEWLSFYYMTPLHKVLDLFFPTAVEKKGRKKREEQPHFEAEAFDFIPHKEKRLHPDQKEALDSIVGSLETGNFHVHLLFGITGSGKTEVYLRAIQRAIALGKKALFLVPEISLTAQLEEKIRSRFSEKVAFIHSRLSPKEKRENWLLAVTSASICIGARSALFVPIPSLGLIIVDEEHEGSYKQSDEAPRYHARDAAIMRAKLEGATVVLGSATPSLESYYNCQKGKYTLNLLHERSSASMPDVQIVDMKREYAHQGRFTLFSDKLLQGIRDRHERGEQSLLFLNRRGFFSHHQCSGCGESIKCPRCDIHMSYHKGEKNLLCHLCDTAMIPPNNCPYCKESGLLRLKGYGTEQVESALHAIFPHIKILRLDRDTTKKRHSLEETTRSFSRGKYDVLIGTQMIAKGLHFPEVTLSAILNADQLLQIPDFRASETAFQLITQVAGRSGRALHQGEVIIQTSMPEQAVILLAKEQNFRAFYEHEILSREALAFPPFSFLIKIFVESEVEGQAKEALEEFHALFERSLLSEMELFAVVAPLRKKTHDRFRFQCLMRGSSPQKMVKALHKFWNDFPEAKKGGSLRWGFDVNPLSLV